MLNINYCCHCQVCTGDQLRTLNTSTGVSETTTAPAETNPLLRGLDPEIQHSFRLLRNGATDSLGYPQSPPRRSGSGRRDPPIRLVTGPPVILPFSLTTPCPNRTSRVTSGVPVPWSVSLRRDWKFSAIPSLNSVANFREARGVRRGPGTSMSSHPTFRCRRTVRISSGKHGTRTGKDDRVQLHLWERCLLLRFQNLPLTPLDPKGGSRHTEEPERCVTLRGPLYLESDLTSLPLFLVSSTPPECGAVTDRE